MTKKQLERKGCETKIYTMQGTMVMMKGEKRRRQKVSGRRQTDNLMTTLSSTILKNGQIILSL